MKKFLIFILFLMVLILAEYYFFMELFSSRRIFILLPGLMVMLLSLFSIFRFAKKNFISTKQTASHN